MELVDAPIYAPASCCLTSQGGQLVDTYRQVAQYGHAYLHPDVVREAALAIGMVDAPVVDDVTDGVIENLNDRYLEVLEQYNNLRGALAELMQHGVTVDRRGILRYREIKPGDRRVKG